MRQDKLTTKFQEALGDAQSLALAHDNQFLEPVHLLAAILHDKDGSAVSLLERAGVNVTVRRKLGGDIDASCGQLRKKAAGIKDPGEGQHPGDGA